MITWCRLSEALKACVYWETIQLIPSLVSVQEVKNQGEKHEADRQMPSLTTFPREEGLITENWAQTSLLPIITFKNVFVHLTNIYACIYTNLFWGHTLGQTQFEMQQWGNQLSRRWLMGVMGGGRTGCPRGVYIIVTTERQQDRYDTVRVWTWGNKTPLYFVFLS